MIDKTLLSELIHYLDEVIVELKQHANLNDETPIQKIVHVRTQLDAFINNAWVKERIG